jgi:predicted small secreted protein
MKKVIAILLVGIYSLLLGCNTMSGAGKDIERGGQKLQNEANEHR